MSGREEAAMEDVHIVQYDDWIELHLEGDMVYEGHSLHWKTLLNQLGISFSYEEFAGYSDDR